MKALNFIIVVIFLSSCGVSHTEYQKLKDENQRLMEELNAANEEKLEYMRQYRVLLEEKNLAEKQKAESKRRAEEIRTTTQRYSESDAIRLIRDYFDFYNSNFLLRNPRARRLSDNQFIISLEECSKGFEGSEFFWKSAVYELKILPNGKYEVKPRWGF